LKKGVADFSSAVQDMLDGCNDSNVLITIDIDTRYGYNREAVAVSRRGHSESGARATCAA